MHMRIIEKCPGFRSTVICIVVYEIRFYGRYIISGSVSSCPSEIVQ